MESGYLVFSLLKEVNYKDNGKPQFIKGELIGYRKSSDKNVLVLKNTKLIFHEDLFYATYAIYDEYIFVSASDSKKEYLEQIKYYPKVEKFKLPLIGNFPICIDDHIYFSTYHVNHDYTHYPLDIYRVKIGDWNNPELLLEEAVESWMPIPGTNIIYTRISIDGHLQNVYYNTKNKTYEITVDRFNPELIKYDGKYMILNTCKDESSGDTKYCLKELPVFNLTFANKDNREISNNLISVNLPNSKKQFTNTFITEKLLYEADEEKLMTFEKTQLRILRNAFFARQGYQFKSDDLQEFFSQFDWYLQLLESYKVLEITNENIVISSKDKERVELIMKIENGI